VAKDLNVPIDPLNPETFKVVEIPYSKVHGQSVAHVSYGNKNGRRLPATADDFAGLEGKRVTFTTPYGAEIHTDVYVVGVTNNNKGVKIRKAKSGKKLDPSNPDTYDEEVFYFSSNRINPNNIAITERVPDEVLKTTNATTTTGRRGRKSRSPAKNKGTEDTGKVADEVESATKSGSSVDDIPTSGSRVDEVPENLPRLVDKGATETGKFQRSIVGAKARALNQLSRFRNSRVLNTKDFWRRLARSVGLAGDDIEQLRLALEEEGYYFNENGELVTPTTNTETTQSTEGSEEPTVGGESLTEKEEFEPGDGEGDDDDDDDDDDGDSDGEETAKGQTPPASNANPVAPPNVPTANQGIYIMKGTH